MIKIIIDSGHGGKDVGGVGKYIEKDINLEVTLKLKKRLQIFDNVEVLTTRETDTFVELSDRTNYANNLNADIFISIHHNSSISNARGYEAIYSAFSEKGKHFAEILCEEFSKYKTKHRGAFFKFNSKERDYFHVIRETTMPAVIGEFEFVQHEVNVDEEVEAYFKTIVRYFNLKEKQEENKEHWAKKHFDSINLNGLKLHEMRFDDAINRGETFKLIDELLKRIVHLEELLKDHLED